MEELNLLSNEIRFDVFEKIVEFCLERELSIAPHLNEAILAESKNHFGKMDVDVAQRLMSWNTVSALQFLMTNYSDRFPPEYMTTKIFIEYVARWWDIMKSRTVTFCFHSEHTNPRSEHFKIWRENYEFLNKFMDFWGSCKIHDEQKSFWKWHKAVFVGTKSILWLADTIVKRDGYRFFLPGRVLNDSIENFFSNIRLFNKAPTCLMFEKFAKALSITQFLKYSPHGSYGEDDSENFFVDLEDFFVNDIKKDIQEEEEDVQELSEEYELEKEDYDPNDFAEDCALSNLAGFVLNKTIGKFGRSKCSKCEDTFITIGECDEQECNQLIRIKSYKDGKLAFPSSLANRLFKSAELTFRSRRMGLLNHNQNVGETILVNVLEDLDPTLKLFDVPRCHLQIIFRRFIRIRCHFWAKRSNEALVNNQKDEIDEIANSSASIKQVQLTHE